VRQALSGRELVDRGSQEPVAMLSLIPNSERSLRPFVNPSTSWSSVTPVVLPGHDDGDPAKAERLLRRAIEHAGFPSSLARHADLEWRRVGFRPGVELASRYRTPAYLAGFPRHHVRVCWRDDAGRPVVVRGPIALGAGRYCGLGLLAGDA